MSFSDIAAVMAEHANTFDELRIIAGEAHLKKIERETLRKGADELESAQRALVAVHMQLIETQQRMIAVNDQLIEARKEIADLKPKLPVYPSLSLSFVAPIRYDRGPFGP